MPTEPGDKQPRPGRLAWFALLAALALGLYALVIWSLYMFEGGWQMGLACLILLAAPPAVWLTVRRRPKSRQGD